MQKKIWDMKWDSFTPIQNKTIPIVLETNKDVIVSSATASGKTEAAFLPILSTIEKSGNESLKVMYISPLKALINNQFERIEKLCDGMDIVLHKWHGDVSQSKKKSFLKSPNGILQITPESIESLFINRTEAIAHIFKGIEYFVIDEIHSFVNADRGVQLRSVLNRIEEHTETKPRIIGLSATIDNFELVKRWVRHENTNNVEIIESKDIDRTLEYHLMHFDIGKERKAPLELYEDIRNELTRDQKSIIFCNSRGGVEETTVKLNRLAQKDGVGETYYAHHSSIDKTEREYVEHIMQETKVPKSIVSTSTLELGIDIGDVDIIIQIDSTFTVSSLKQRLGRSGRKQGTNQVLQLYTTSDDQLLQSIAVMELILEKWIEPATGYPVPYDILFHQILSICKAANGLTKVRLIEAFNRNHIFYALEDEKISGLIDHMVKKDHLEQIQGRGEIIVGLEGERILNSKDFYTVFMTSESYTVLNGTRKIGMFDKTHLISEGDNVILAGKLWTVVEIDTKRSKVFVEGAFNGNPPKYVSGEANIHPHIGEKMLELLCSEKDFIYIDENAKTALHDMRRLYRFYEVKKDERMLWKQPNSTLFETFAGSKIARNLSWALRYLDFNVRSPDGVGRIEIDESEINLEEVFEKLQTNNWTEDMLFEQITENELFFTKYSEYLPQELEKEIQKANQIDISGMIEYLNTYNFRTVNLEYRSW